MSFKLPRLSSTFSITDTKTGRALTAFTRFWDAAMTKIEGQFEVTGSGFVSSDGTGLGTGRTIIGSVPIIVTNGDGLAGNPTLSLKGDVGMGLSGTGLYEDGEFLGSAIWDFAIAFPSTEFTSLAVSQFQAAADAVIAFKVGGVTKGTLTFLAGHTSGSVSWPGGYTLPADTILQVYGPATHDATLSGITATIYGDRA